MTGSNRESFCGINHIPEDPRKTRSIFIDLIYVFHRLLKSSTEIGQADKNELIKVLSFAKL